MNKTLIHLLSVKIRGKFFVFCFPLFSTLSLSVLFYLFKSLTVPVKFFRSLFFVSFYISFLFRGNLFSVLCYFLTQKLLPLRSLGVRLFVYSLLFLSFVLSANSAAFRFVNISVSSVFVS